MVGSQQSYKQRNFRLMATNDCREYLVTNTYPEHIRGEEFTVGCSALVYSVAQDSDVINY